ncbi:MAG: hypothetical protein IJ125_09960 [Atopobiaceae bacterium]|nr:hypothetical protein [Atopobiaceae bacterium]
MPKKDALEQPSSALAYMLISNNPHVHYPEMCPLDLREATEPEIQAVLWQFIFRFIDGGNNPDRDPKLNCVMAVAEVGDEGTPHVQLFVFSKNPIKFYVLQKKYPHSNISALRGSYDDALAYTYKTGKHEEKKHTQICEPVIWGEWKSDNSFMPRGGVFEKIDALLSSGVKPSSIYAMGAKFAHYRGATDTAYAAMLRESIPPVREVVVTYHCGLSGTGKSYSRLQLMERLGRDEVYIVNDYEHPWDMYNYEKCVFLDELRGDSMSIPELLAACDDYTYQLKCRYANKLSNWNELHIASILPPEALFDAMRFNTFHSTEHESYQQFKRRIDYVTYHYKYGDEFKEYTVPMSEYVSFTQIVDDAR